MIEIRKAEEGIAIGDVVVDLASGQPLQVVSQARETAGDHEETRSDELADLFGSEPDEPVYHCVFLPTPDERISPPSKTYAYPESRLLRFPVERATESPGIQTLLRSAFIEELVDAAIEVSGPEGIEFLERVVAEAYTPDVADLVYDLAVAKGEFDP